MNRGYKINYVTKNSFEWMGWESKDLTSQNVNVIIPQPFKKFHHQYMNIKNINGSILMHKSVRPIVCELHDKTLYPVEIGIRLAMSLQHGYQFIGVLNFLKSSKDANCEDIVLSLDQDGKIIQSSKVASNYFDEDILIQEQVPELSMILPEFDFITSLKNKNQELAEILETDLYTLSERTDIDIPYKIMKRLKHYLPYCSEFKDNKISEADLDTDKHNLQKNCYIDLFNNDREESRVFQVNISDFWYQDHLGGRFVIFHRSFSEHTFANRSLQFILTQNEYLKIWDSWERYVYKILIYEQAKDKARGIDRQAKKMANKMDGLLGKNFATRPNLFGTSVIGTQSDFDPTGGFMNQFSSQNQSKSFKKELVQTCSLDSPAKQPIEEEDSLLEEINEIEGEAMETRRFGTHNNLDVLRNMTSTQSNTTGQENAGDEEIGESNHLDLMEWTDPTIDEGARLNFKKNEKAKYMEDQINKVNEKIAQSNNKTQSNKVIIISKAEEEKKDSNELDFLKKGTDTTKSRMSNNPMNTNVKNFNFNNFAEDDVIIEEKFESSPMKQPRQVLFQTKESDQIEEFDESNEEENPSLERRKAKNRYNYRKTKTIMKNIKKGNKELGSNSNNRPASQAANSVSSTVISQFVKVKKTISYLIHHNPKLSSHKNKWVNVLGENIQSKNIGKLRHFKMEV